MTDYLFPMVKLKEIAHIVTGSTPSKKNPKYFGGDIPFVTPAELNDEVYVNSAATYVTKNGADQARIIPKNSVMICCIGSLGKTAIAGKDLVTNQQINSLIVNDEKADPLYVYYYCITLKPILECMAPKTTISIVNKSRFSNLEIPLPPVSIQKQIAEVLEKADKLCKKSQQVKKELNALAQSVFSEIFGDYSVGDNFQYLSSLAEVVSGVTKGQKFRGRETKIVPYLRVANVQNGYLDLKVIKKIEATLVECKKYQLEDGDVLLTEGGDFDKLGRGAIWSGQINECIHQNHIFRVRLDQVTVSPKFFEYFLQTPFARRYFLKCAKKTTNLASINMSQLKKLPVPVESIEKQKVFLNIIDKIEHLKGINDDKLFQCMELFNSLLQKSFSDGLDLKSSKIILNQEGAKSNVKL